jgi:hypothetical protein
MSNESVDYQLQEHAIGMAGPRDDEMGEIWHPLDNDQYILEVDGKTYDTRQGMTWPVYEALWWCGEADAHMLGTNDQAIYSKIDNWHKHFDTEQLDGDTYPVTLLTGESLEGNIVPRYNGRASYGRDCANRTYATRIECSVNSVYEKRSRSSQYELLFRPAVIIG